MVGDASPDAGDLLPGGIVPSWCGVGGSFVGVVLSGVCPVAPVGTGWGGVAQGSCLAVVARWVLGLQLYMEPALCGGGFVSFLGMELNCGGVPLCGGNSGRLGSGACVRYLCPGWGWPCGEIHVGVHGGWGWLTGFRSEFIGGLGLFHPMVVLGTTSWVRGPVAPMGYRYLDLGM
ncbi:hypothetical protein AMECASPLE_010977 [Ameca splendens]|uniref:Uncharacterized protein n=1 Tax=Ameca splendens TaxID=208324 RepID=A0ABV0ZKD0_9TELE